MTKRLLSLFLVCILAIPILAFPASATTQDVVDAIEDLQAGLGTSQADIRDYLKSIDYWAQHIDSLITNNLISAINNARDQISDSVATVHDAIDELQAGLGTSQRDILNALQTLDASVTGVVTNAINNCTSTLGSWLEYIHSYMVNNLGPAINNMSDRIATYLGYIDDHIINNVVGTINNFSSMVGEMLADIHTLITQLVKGESSSVDDFNSAVDEDKTQFEDAFAQIQEETRPDPDNIDLDVDQKVPTGDVTKIGNLLAIFFNNQYIYIVFFIAFTFALVSYGIFGKRG